MPFLPYTLRGRLALIAVLAALWIVATTVYIRRYPYSFRLQQEGLQESPDSDVPTSPPTLKNSSSPNSPSRVLIVTSWFPVLNPRFTDEEYNQWLPNFFGSNRNDIYLYTTPEFEERFRSLRGGHLTLTINTHFASPFDIPPLKGKEDAYRRNMKKDRAKSKKSIDLYANRNAKPFLLYNAVSRLEHLGKKYDFAFWSDAGSFREQHVYTEWPSLARLNEVWEAGYKLSDISKDNLIFVPASHGPYTSMIFWTEAMGPIDNDISIGSFFGGTPHALGWFTRVYYVYHDHYLSFDVFIGKSQALINSLLFLYPNRFITVWANEPDSSGRSPESSTIGQCGKNRRFYYEFWLASSTERKEMQQKWVKEASARDWWGWWKTRDATPCKTTRVLPIETMLKSKLGVDWVPPAKAVEIPDTTGWGL